MVLVIGCTVRKELLGPYGAPAENTPFLSELAERGVVFEDLIASAPWTRPAHVTLLTGQEAADVGMIELGDQVNSRVLAPEVLTLAEQFQAAGYATVGGTANPNINAIFGFDQGFDQYHEGSALWRHVPLDQVKALGEPLVEAVLEATAEVPRERPVYAQLTLIDTHLPHTTSPEVGQGLTREGEPLTVGQYRGDLALLDGAIARLHEGLEAQGRSMDDTLFVFVADHGEGLTWPDPRLNGHGQNLLESQVAIPWILAGPGLPRGARVAGLASQLDVLPTVAALAGLPPPEVPGTSWSMQVRQAPARTTRSRAFAATWKEHRERAGIHTATQACEEGRPLVWEQADGATTAQCWDRATDPHALSPLPMDADLHKALSAWKAERLAAFTAWPHTRDARTDLQPIEALEALGYLDPAADEPSPATTEASEPVELGGSEPPQR